MDIFCVYGGWIELLVIEMMMCDWYVEGLVICLVYGMMGYIGFFVILCCFVLGVVVLMCKCCFVLGVYGFDYYGLCLCNIIEYD